MAFKKNCIDEARSFADGTLLEEILDSTPSDAYHAAGARNVDLHPNTQGRFFHSLVGRCIASEHPTLMGRARIRWRLGDVESERWLPMLHGVSIRENDRVMIEWPVNSDEAIVVGVVDGYKKRPDKVYIEGASLSLQKDESITVKNDAGETLLKLYQDESGPVVRLLKENANLDMPGKLRIRAKDIAFTATQGQVKISATEDVIVNGEMVKLNP